MLVESAQASTPSKSMLAWVRRIKLQANKAKIAAADGKSTLVHDAKCMTRDSESGPEEEQSVAAADAKSAGVPDGSTRFEQKSVQQLQPHYCSLIAASLQPRFQEPPMEHAVRFNLRANTYHEVTAYSEIYGVHPRYIWFDKHEQASAVSFIADPEAEDVDSEEEEDEDDAQPTITRSGCKWSVPAIPALDTDFIFDDSDLEDGECTPGTPGSDNSTGSLFSDITTSDDGEETSSVSSTVEDIVASAIMCSSQKIMKPLQEFSVMLCSLSLMTTRVCSSRSTTLLDDGFSHTPVCQV